MLASKRLARGMPVLLHNSFDIFPQLWVASVASSSCFSTTRDVSSSAPPAASSSTASSPLFSKLLVANRGEIAVRIMRTARRLGIPTVAVYSDADADAVHTRFADEAIRIGPPPSTQSYLNVDAVIDAMKQTGADAVHPGYGFLSENEAFASAVAASGATFVGPPANAVRAMGDKVESKRFAKAAGVHTIPGWVGVVENAEHAVGVARDIGFPVMVKASAGGGGKGMRICWDEKDLLEGYALASQEAAASFGDDRMLIEKFIERPRHVEIQVLGDKHGHVIYLPERECSIQRRNQKVIEEAPSPVGDPALRRAMGEQAVALCKAVGYYSAGTCEFLVDPNKQFYFLEMNTRLQVEHPITEAITGLDLVEQMLRVAAGHHLGISQDQVTHPKGWAVECRVYAEDPARGFLPSTGRLLRYAEPRGPGIRVDSGVEEGSEISMWYDPMISKLVSHGPDRAAALAGAARALDAYVIRGVQHNAPLLRSVLDAPDFVAGDFSTAFLADHFPTPQSSAPAALPLSPRHEQDVRALAAALHVWNDLREANGDSKRVAVALGDGIEKGRRLAVGTGTGAHHHSHGDGDRQTKPKTTSVVVRPATADHHASRAVGVDDDAAAWAPPLEVELGDRVVVVALQSLAPPPATARATPPLVAVTIDGHEALCQVVERGPRHVTLQYRGAHRQLTVDGPAAAALVSIMPVPVKEDLSRTVRSPMPGVLVSLSVAVGDEVEEGDEVAVVEAMKMRNVLRAGATGKVVAVEAKEGGSVAADQVIARLD